MTQSALPILWLTAALTAGVLGPAGGTFAASAPQPGDFQVIESCVFTSTCDGTFTVINNSEGDGDWYVYQFLVANPDPLSADRTQTNWDAEVCGLCSGKGFDYFNDNVASDAPADLANDVGPGQSSDLFTFSALTPGSPVTVDVVDAGGNVSSIPVTTRDLIPEPASVVILAGALLGLAGVFRARCWLPRAVVARERARRISI